MYIFIDRLGIISQDRRAATRRRAKTTPYTYIIIIMCLKLDYLTALECANLNLLTTQNLVIHGGG